MVKRDVPKCAKNVLPNGRTLLSHSKRTTRAHLLSNIHLARPYKQLEALKGKRRRPQATAAPATQQGQGVGDIFCFAKKIAKSKVASNIGKMALEQLPGAIEKLSGKVKKKTEKNTWF